MKVHVSATSRHLVLRAASGELLPGALTRALVDNGVTGGWVRASGVLENVELRALDSEAGVQGPPRKLGGRAHVIALEGSVGIVRGALDVGMRVLLARETDSGLQTLAGEIVSARVVALEAIVTVFDDLALTREVDGDAGVALIASAIATESATRRAPAAPMAQAPTAAAYAPPPAPSAPAASAWSDAAAVSSQVEKQAEREAYRPAPLRSMTASASAQSSVTSAVPQRIARPQVADDDGLLPEAGDSVEHFAFGTGDVVKSDGDRLHIRVGKEGKIREIALEMLKVTPLANDGEKRRFRLERKL